MGDGSKRDSSQSLCLNVVRGTPRCMDLLTAEDVIRAIETYFDGGRLPYLTPEQFRAAQVAVRQPLEQLVV